MDNKKIIPLEPLTAITPLDGRYRERVEKLAPYISEYALIKTRIEIEAKYLIALSDEEIIRKFTVQEKKKLLTLVDSLSLDDIAQVKKIEQETRHDVKAMERAFRSLLQNTSLIDQLEMIHFGLTSEDINNLAYRLLLKRATEHICLPAFDEIVDELLIRTEQYKTIPMLARTHGQAAVPTTVGKEFAVFLTRLQGQVEKLKEFRLHGKFNGAVGNFNALHYTFPKIDWISFSQKFVSSFGFIPNLITTQINTYEDVVEMLQIYQRINTVLIDFDQDIWRYISDHWFVQEVKKGEIGSSTMPQKVNPIDFENSESNLGMANAMIEFFSRKLPISRLQRDLSDSTAVRNISVVLGYSLIGYTSLLTGLSRIRPDEEQIVKDLNKDYAILAEAVQTILRKSGIPDPYSLIASLTRGEQVDPTSWKKWVDKLPIDTALKKQLHVLTPQKYVGFAEALCDLASKKSTAKR